MTLKNFIPDLVIDAKDAVVGRVASYAAKQALQGKNVSIVNSNHSLITGNKNSIVADYKEAIARISSNPVRGPHYPKSPERVMKRTVRGMLPIKAPRGRTALKKVRCFSEIPNELKDAKLISMARPQVVKTITLKKMRESL